MMYGVILAGGSGTRFWPKSREQVPKQLLKICGKGTLVQNTVERLLPLIPIKNIFLVTNVLHALETCRQMDAFGFLPSQLLAEPVGRNTAPAIAVAARILAEENPDAIMAVFPADHVVQDPENFRRILEQGKVVAEKGYLVTLGIPPSRAETGYGYIKKGNPLKEVNEAFQVERFVEKPDSQTAESCLREGGYFWNCGVFLWKVSVLLDEIKTHLPDLHNRLDAIVSHTVENKKSFHYRLLDEKGKEIYESLASISVDYGILEKSQRVALVPADIQWSDVGAWNALEEVLGKDANGNVVTENVILTDCSGAIIQGEDRLIAAIGLKDVVVVDTPDALLVCDKNRAQEVKKLVEKLKADNRPEATLGTTVQKPWGSYTVLEKKANYLVKRLDVYPGEQLSLQSHNHRTEHWTVVAGSAKIALDGKQHVLHRDESIFIPKYAKHRLSNPNKTLLTLIEVQIGDRLDEDDIVRYQDDYDRI